MDEGRQITRQRPDIEQLYLINKGILSLSYKGKTSKNIECGSDMIRSTCQQGHSVSEMGPMGQS